MSEGVSASPRRVQFNMEVDEALRQDFAQACGSVSQSTVTRQLWRMFIALNALERMQLLVVCEDQEMVRELVDLHRKEVEQDDKEHSASRA